MGTPKNQSQKAERILEDTSQNGFFLHGDNNFGVVFVRVLFLSLVAFSAAKGLGPAFVSLRPLRASRLREVWVTRHLRAPFRMVRGNQKDTATNMLASSWKVHKPGAGPSLQDLGDVYENPSLCQKTP